MPGKIVLDANVLYSARLRDLWMELGVSGLVDLVWTEQIEAEWIAAVLRSRPELEQHLRRTAVVMRQVLPNACIVVDPTHELGLALPDPDDRHVVAAAVTIRAESIVTFNVKNFPPDLVTSLQIEIVTADTQLLRVAMDDEEGFLAAVASVRRRLRAPPLDAFEYAAGLPRSGCPLTATWLSKRADQF